MTQSGYPPNRDKVIFLRAWVGKKVNVITSEKWTYSGILTTIAFDNTRLMYIMLDDKRCLNYDHVVEINVED